MRDIYIRKHHAGPQIVLTSFRENYWSPGIWRFLQNYLFHSRGNKCLACFHFLAKPYPIPPMPQLPSSRVNPGRPFQNVGIDYFGPAYIKTMGEDKKIWICLLTCFRCRAVHLEIVMDCTTSALIKALRRFLARFGIPESFLSDNATYFKLGAAVIERIFHELNRADEVQNFVASHVVKWKFIIENAPWKGAIYERLVSNVKYCLRRTCGRKRFDLESFQTLLMEIELVVNSRPLTTIFESGIERALRPVDFLMPLVSDPIITTLEADDPTDPEFTLKDKAAETLIRDYQKSLHCLDVFWKEWSTNYILSLREKQRNMRERNTTIPRVDEVVLIGDDETPRNMWRIGRITSLLQSGDGKVRSATVRAIPGNAELRRPIQKLYPLEISNEEKITLENESGKADAVKIVAEILEPERGHEIQVRTTPSSGIEQRSKNGKIPTLTTVLHQCRNLSKPCLLC